MGTHNPGYTVSHIQTHTTIHYHTLSSSNTLCSSNKQLHLQEEEVGKPEFQSQPAQSHHAEKEGYGDAEGEAERRRELAEEEMEQAGQPQKLEEESEQPQEDERLEAEQDQPDDNALDHQRRQPQQVRTTLEPVRTA